MCLNSKAITRCKCDVDEPLEQMLVASLAIQHVVVTGLRTTSTKPKGYLRIKHLLLHQLNNPSNTIVRGYHFLFARRKQFLQ